MKTVRRLDYFIPLRLKTLRKFWASKKKNGFIRNLNIQIGNGNDGHNLSKTHRTSQFPMVCKFIASRPMICLQ